MTFPTHDSSTAGVTSIGDVTFDSNSDNTALLADLTLEDWLDTAGRDFAMLRIATVLVSGGDNDIESKLRSSPEMEAWLEYLDGLDDWRRRSRALIEVCDCAEARLLVTLTRLADAEIQRNVGY